MADTSCRLCTIIIDQRIDMDQCRTMSWPMPALSGDQVLAASLAKRGWWRNEYPAQTQRSDKEQYPTTHDPVA
jgi:hypothetical protein